MTEVEGKSHQITTYPRMRVYVFLPVLTTLVGSLLVLSMNPLIGLVEQEGLYMTLAVALFVITALSISDLLLLMTSSVKIQMWRAYAVSCIKARNSEDRATQLHEVSIECHSNAVLGFIPIVTALIVGLLTLAMPRLWYPVFGIPELLIAINLGVLGCAFGLEWVNSKNLTKYVSMSPEEIEQLYESVDPDSGNCDYYEPISGTGSSLLRFPQILVFALLFAIAWVITFVLTHVLPG